VDIESTSQFDAFLHTLDRSQADNNKGEEYSKLGYMVKELRLISYDVDCKIATLTQDRLNALGDFCPRLEVLELGSSQWENISNMAVFERWKNLKSIAPVLWKHIHCLSFTPNLTKLYILHTPQENDKLFAVFSKIPFLKHLTLNILDGPSNAHTGFNLDQYLKTIHTTVPQLERLCLGLTFAKIQNKAPSPNTIHHNRINLKSLSLKGITSPHNWFHYISKNYYLLENLEILDPIISQVNIHIQTDALVHLVLELPSLKKLSLQGGNIWYLYSEALTDEFAKPGCSVRQFEYSFYGFDLNKSTKFLDAIKACPLKHLKQLYIRVTDQHLLWPGSLEGLYQCKNLDDVEICFARHFMHPYTDFVLDEFLLQLPRIKRLRLQKADVRIDECDKKIGSLQELDLEESRVLEIEELCRFINKQCISLSQLTLAQEKENVVLNLSNRRLDKLSYQCLNYYFWRATPCVENRPELNNFCWDNKTNPRRLTSMKELADLKESDYGFGSSLVQIHCKSLRQLFVDGRKLSFHHEDK
jgi:hypothetical protein